LEKKDKKKKKLQPLTQRRVTPLPPRPGPRAAQERARASLPLSLPLAIGARRCVADGWSPPISDTIFFLEL